VTLMSPADIVGLIMAGDFVSQLNIGALMLAELHGFLALPRKAKGGQYAKPGAARC
jgi:hypothetical protein